MEKSDVKSCFGNRSFYKTFPRIHFFSLMSFLIISQNFKVWLEFFMTGVWSDSGIYGFKYLSWVRKCLQRMHLFPDQIKDSHFWLCFTQKLFMSVARQRTEKGNSDICYWKGGARSWIGFLVSSTGTSCTSCLECEEKARKGGITLSRLYLDVRICQSSS